TACSLTHASRKPSLSPRTISYRSSAQACACGRLGRLPLENIPNSISSTLLCRSRLHHCRKLPVHFGPRPPDLRSKSVAKSGLKRIEERLSHRRVVGGLDAI